MEEGKVIPYSGYLKRFRLTKIHMNFIWGIKLIRIARKNGLLHGSSLKAEESSPGLYLSGATIHADVENASCASGNNLSKLTGFSKSYFLGPISFTFPIMFYLVKRDDPNFPGRWHNNLQRNQQKIILSSNLQTIFKKRLLRVYVHKKLLLQIDLERGTLGVSWLSVLANLIETKAEAQTFPGRSH